MNLNPSFPYTFIFRPFIEAPQILKSIHAKVFKGTEALLSRKSLDCTPRSVQFRPIVVSPQTLVNSKAWTY